MSRRFFLLAILTLGLIPAILSASLPAQPNADDPALESRLMVLAEDLRCVVCQNESLAESRASLALDLKDEIREMMSAGMTDAAVVESLVGRYGDFVLYRPPVKPLTYALWGGPIVFLLIGIALAAAALYRRRTLEQGSEIDPETLRQAARLLRTDDYLQPPVPARPQPQPGPVAPSLHQEKR